MRNSPKSQRKATCNTIGGILLGYAAIMLVTTMVSLLLSAGYSALMAGLGNLIDPSHRALLPESLDESGPGYVLAALLVVLMIRLWKGQGYLPQVMKKQGSMNPLVFVGILGIFLSVQTVSGVLISYTENILNHWGLTSMLAQEQASGQSSTFSMFLYVGILAPIVEELMFRGAIYDALRPYGQRFAMVSSALLFGLFHGNLIQIPFAFLVGLVLSYVRSEYGMIWCMLLHFVNNCILVELLSPYGEVTETIMVVSLLVAVVTLSLRGNHLRHQVNALPTTSKGAYRDLFLNPLTIVLMGYCLLSTLLTITPASVV